MTTLNGVETYRTLKADGIYNEGSLALMDGVIGASSNADGNASQSPGGGLLNGQMATLNDVPVQHNKAPYGGGIENDGRVLLTGGSLSGNHATERAASIITKHRRSSVAVGGQPGDRPSR